MKCPAICDYARAIDTTPSQLFYRIESLVIEYDSRNPGHYQVVPLTDGVDDQDRGDA